MESSEFGAINCVVGTIVWVRRRNGSWWPGKILGSEELSASHLMSPRSGTPVKLLGREDASVDWYNLEKSKRVKAFRCGEFNDCIERAESSQGIRSKKREKYARREDAILHALELEKHSIENKHNVLGTVLECRASTLTDSVKSDPKKLIEKGKCIISKSQQIYKRMDVSYKDNIKVVTHGFQNSEDRNKLRFVDDTSEAVPRMRFLQDFGLRNASSIQKKFSLMSNGVGTNNSHVASLLDKNKRDAESLVNEECMLKKKAKQTGVRAKRSKCIYVQPHLNESIGSPKMLMEIPPSYTKEGNREPHLDTLVEGSSCQHTSNNESNYSQAECINPEIDEVVSPLLGGQKDGGCVASGHGNSNCGSPEGRGEMSHPNPRSTLCGGKSMSKWKLKGKRNSRGVSKRISYPNDIKFPFRGSIPMPSLEEMGQPSCTREASRWSFNMFSNGGIDDDDDDIDRIFENPDIIGSEIDDRVSKLQDIRGRCLMPEYPLSWTDADWEPCFSDSHHPFVDRHHDHYHNDQCHIGSLFQVDLRVQNSYQKEHVPIVSLMSRLNGKAIIGHPIQIQILEDQSSDTILHEKLADPDTTHIPSMWRTARRTANRVRRAKNSSELTEPPSSQSPRGHRKATISPAPRTPAEGKVVTKVKVQKKVGWYSRKMRTLSSIATQQHEKMPEPAGFTTVACVPVNLVFTRLFEGISRPVSR